MTGFSVCTADQRSDAWRLARVGLLTASRAADMLATVKKGEAAGRRDLRLQLVCERLTGRPQDDVFVSKDMQRGIDLEAAARLAYEAATGLLVRPVGFLTHNTIPAGCSPDGVIGDFVGVLEIKCPKSSTHLAALTSRAVPVNHLAQITHALWITGAAWADFVSFDDRFPARLQFFRARVERSQKDVDAYALAAQLFLSEVDRELEVVSKLANA